MSPPDSSLSSQSIVLIGMMGSGKSSVGKKLATHLNLPFVDSDTEIQREAGMTIVEIFERFGEPYFREAEAGMIATLLDKGPAVISTGGGAILNQGTADRIFKNTISIWLDAPIPVLARRTQNNTDRPLLNNNDQEQTLIKLMNARRAIYERACIHQDSASDDVDAIAEALIPKINTARMSRI